MKHLIIYLLLLGLAPLSWAHVSVEEALLTTRTEIEQASDALQQQREGIAEQRKPLAAKLTTLQQEVQALRREVKTARQQQQSQKQAQTELEVTTKSLRQQCRFIQGLLQEYRRAWETRATATEATHWEPALQEIDRCLSDSDSWDSLPQATQGLLQLAQQWNQQRVGGTSFTGIALDEQGLELKGRFALVGPLVYFSSNDQASAGIIATQPGQVLPSVQALDAESQIAIGQLVQGQEVMVPVDVTEGDALKIQQAHPPLIEQIKKGGFVMVPLLIVGALALLLTLYKIIDLACVRVRADQTIIGILGQIKAGDIKTARQQAQTLSQPLAGLVQAAIDFRESPREHLEEILHEHVFAYVPRLERCLGTLAVFGGIAPLLGLLGTVTGMIHTFQLVTLFGSGDAKLLSGGISEALITTEFGLAIAIPVLLVHAYLSRRTRSIISSLEQTAMGLVNELKIKAVA